MTASSSSTTNYFIHAYNHIGYAQVLEELPSVGATPDVTYTIGNDIVTQSRQSATYPEHFLYDGHGSVRQLANPSGANREVFKKILVLYTSIIVSLLI